MCGDATEQRGAVVCGAEAEEAHSMVHALRETSCQPGTGASGGAEEHAVLGAAEGASRTEARGDRGELGNSQRGGGQRHGLASPRVR